MIAVVNLSGRSVPTALLRRAARAAMGRRSVTVAVLDDRGMAKLHRRHLGKWGPTDVLAFPPDQVAVCPAVARREARERGLDWREELARYVIHGCLHLRGYRDKKPTDRKRMWATQERLLAKAGLGG